MKKNLTRTRFAPAPTGIMHLGNIRTAVMNYLFARQKEGTFVLRIEDTDPERIYDPNGKKIKNDLAWLNISYDEGPGADGLYAPYIQSERTTLYQEKLNTLIKNGSAYRCFCTPEELEKKRQRQKALKQPPRYDRTCLHLSEEDIAQKCANKAPYIWRFKLDHTQTITITDMARGNITFALKNFSDFPITRQNGSFTFMFANAIDDMAMHMTDIIRGEDHLTNTAGQVALLSTFNAPLPTFFHMPILCNIDGKKLSKRDFGFSLDDLKEAGFLPEAICNYLATLGGSFEDEILSLEELAQGYNFDRPQVSGHIKYDVEKLRWMNHKWINRYDPKKLAHACRPFLETAYPKSTTIDTQELARIVQLVKTDLVRLPDAVRALQFYFITPTPPASVRETYAPYRTQIQTLIQDCIDTIDEPSKFATQLKKAANKNDLPLRIIFSYIRLILTGKEKGPPIYDVISIIGPDTARARLID